MSSDPRRGPRSLFGELLDWMLAPMLVIWPMGVLLTWWVAQGLAAQPYDRALGEVARTVANQLSHPGQVPRLPPEARFWLQAEEDDLVVFQVLGRHGELLAGERRLPTPEPGASPGQLQWRDEELGVERLRVASLWVRAEPQDQQLMLVQVAESLGKRERLANNIVGGVTLPLFLLLPLAALLAWLALVQGFRPLEALQRRIRERSPDDLSPIELDEVPEEVVPLVSSVNELLTRRDEAMRGQKRFLADAAHQLKTPLAGLRTQAELAGRALRAGVIDVRELQRSFDQISLSSQRAANMVNQLLSLARAEAGGTVAAPEPVDLVDLARQVTQDFVPMALAKRIDIGYDGPDEARLRVPGARWQLEELLRNLVDNALRYTPTGGEVTVRVSEDPFGKVTVLEVEDSGPGIAPDARERVFQPFYRALGTGVDGSGLGLTIAGQIAVRHGSRIEVSDARERRGPDTLPGARFTLRLQAEPPPAPARPD